MPNFRLSPFASFIESHLNPSAPQYGVFHRLTGQILELEPSVRTFLEALAQGKGFSLTPEQLPQLGELGPAILRLVDFQLVIPVELDPLTQFVDYYVSRPMQNPALTYRNDTEVLLVSVSMTDRVYSPEPGKLPAVTEE